MIRTQQDQVGQFGEPAVFPMPNVVCVQSAGGATAWNRAGPVTVLECAAKPSADRAGRSAGTDDLTVTFEPDFTRGITGEVLAVGVGEQRTEMQCRDALSDVDVHHHRGALPVRAPGRLGVPAGFNQAHERISGVGHRPSLIRFSLAAVIMLPLGDQRIEMGLQCGVERRRLVVAQGDPPARGLFAGSLGDRARRWWRRPGIGFGPRLQPDRGAQLVDRGYGGQLRVMLIGPLAGSRRYGAELIQRQPALPHALRAAGELLDPVGDRGDRVGVDRGHPQLPGHQRRDRTSTRHPAQPITIHLRDDLHDAPIDGVALTGQLRQLPEQHLKTLSGRDDRGRGHTHIIATGSDKNRCRSDEPMNR